MESANLRTAEAVHSDGVEMISLAELQRRHVLKVLTVMGGRREASARVLGISRRTLSRMLHRWGVNAPYAVSRESRME